MATTAHVFLRVEMSNMSPRDYVDNYPLFNAVRKPGVATGTDYTLRSFSG